MKTILILIFSLAVGLTTSNAQESIELSGVVIVEVKGLSCPFCAYGLEKNLKKIKRIEKVTINIKEALVTLIIKEGSSILQEDIIKRVEDAGFTAGDIKEISRE